MAADKLLGEFSIKGADQRPVEFWNLDCTVGFRALGCRAGTVHASARVTPHALLDHPQASGWTIGIGGARASMIRDRSLAPDAMRV